MRRTIVLALLLMAARSLPAQAPDDSRAVFQMAAQRPQGSAESIALLERYVRLEPTDAWGFLALAESQAAARHFDEALRHVERAAALAPGEEDVEVVRQRVLRARRNAAPAIQPRTSYTRDSDANRLIQTSLAGDLSTGRTSRFGFSVTHSGTGDDFDSFKADEARAHFNVRTASTRLELSGGAARVDALNSFTTAVGRARLRINPRPTAALADIRLTRTPVLVSPLLMVNQVVLTEARGTFELPLGKVFRLRANGQIGDMSSAEIDTITFDAGRSRSGGGMRNSLVNTRSHNTRTGMGGGLVARTGSSSEVSATYYQLSYESPATAGYFAPRLVRLIEAGTYTEIYDFDPLTVALDLGAGAQQVAQHGDELGEWKPALRAWAMLTLPLARAVELNIETDWYRSQLGTVATSSTWNSLSGALSLKWRIGG